jgi:hypothetical protein
MIEKRTDLILLLILCFAIVSISGIKIAKAQDANYIRAEEALREQTILIGEGDVFTLISDINGSILM